MKKTIIALLSSIGIVTIGAMNAHAGENSYNSGVNLFSSDSGRSSSLVRLFRPSRAEPSLDQVNEADDRSITVVKYTDYSISYPRHRTTRSQARKSAVGHRYLGFTKQYSGNRYPF